MMAQIITSNKDLIDSYDLHLWKIVKVLPPVNKWPGIQVEAINKIGNLKGQNCSVYLKVGEYKIL